MTITPAEIEGACTKVSTNISLNEYSAGTHVVTEVDGLESLTDEVAMYLYGCVASHVDCSLKIVQALVGTAVDERQALKNDIQSLLIAADPTRADFFTVQHRNPWILEGIGHLMLKLSKEHPKLGPPGEVMALTVLHDDVKDHGLDQVGIFAEEELLSVNIGEAKASENGIAAHIDDTGRKFQEVRKGHHDFHIRSEIQQLRNSLPGKVQELVTPSFWKNSQAFIAIAGFGTNASVDLTSSRVCYERVSVDSNRIRLIAIKLTSYSEFFKKVSTALLNLV